MEKKIKKKIFFIDEKFWQSPRTLVQYGFLCLRSVTEKKIKLKILGSSNKKNSSVTGFHIDFHLRMHFEAHGVK